MSRRAKKILANILIVLFSLQIVGVSIQKKPLPASRAEAWGELTGYFLIVAGLAGSIGWRRKLAHEERNTPFLK